MSAWKLNSNKQYSFYRLTFKWSLSAWAPQHLTDQESSTGSLAFLHQLCVQLYLALWSAGYWLEPLARTGWALPQQGCRAAGKEQWGTGPPGVSQPPSCALLPENRGCQGFLSWAMAQLCFSVLFPANKLCCHFNSQVRSHNTQMLSTSFTYRKHQFLDDWIY